MTTHSPAYYRDLITDVIKQVNETAADPIPAWFRTAWNNNRVWFFHDEYPPNLLHKTGDICVGVSLPGDNEILKEIILIIWINPQYHIYLVEVLPVSNDDDINDDPDSKELEASVKSILQKVLKLPVGHLVEISPILYDHAGQYDAVFQRRSKSLDVGVDRQLRSISDTLYNWAIEAGH